jgi:hypothetical protein
VQFSASAKLCLILPEIAVQYMVAGVKWRGAVFLSAGSNGRLAFLNNVVGIFEAEIDMEGNFSEKSWEWK